MSRTVINVAAVMEAENLIRSASSEVSSAKSTFSQVRNSVDDKIQNRANIRGRMSTISGQLNSIDSKLSQIRSTVQSGASQYRAADERVEGYRSQMQVKIAAKEVVGKVSQWASLFIDTKKKDVPKNKDTADTAAAATGIASASFAGQIGGVTIDGGVEVSGPSGKNESGKGKVDMSGSLLSGSAELNAEAFGVTGSTKLEGELIGGSVKTKSKASFGWKDGEDEGGIKEFDAGIEYGIAAEGHLAKGSIEHSLGIYHSEKEASVGNVGASGSVGLTLFDHGKLSPSIGLEVKGKASVLEYEESRRFGSEDNNIHVDSGVTVLGAEAEAAAGAGMITYEAKDGTIKTELGARAEVSAEAYAVEGTASGGFTIFGVDIEIGVTGKAGGAGVEAGGRVTAGGVSGKIGAGLGLGLGIEISIDWSDFKFW